MTQDNREQLCGESASADEQVDAISDDLCRELRNSWNAGTKLSAAELILNSPLVRRSPMNAIDVAITEFELIDCFTTIAEADPWIRNTATSVDTEFRAEFEKELTKRLELFIYSKSIESNSDKLEELEKDVLPRFDKYQVETILGEGGMGIVYRAKQLDPVKRTVAIKVIKPGLDSRDILRRFEMERQTLAIMDHESIARILDAGITADSRPYFVMEYVRGQPIVEFCREKKMTLRQRIQLVALVCQAVKHAHQKGVIHRDLKPGNILVSRAEDEKDGLHVKIIDFGLAKAIGSGLRLDSMQTQFGQIVGTLEYMSPEQAGVVDQDIDTRSDVYSIGVILFELLTGSLLLSLKNRTSAELVGLKALFESVDSRKPSNEISKITDPKNNTGFGDEYLAANAKRIHKEIKGELDWIVAKAVSFDRSRRYDSVSSLAEELERFLNFEPIQARPPSMVYRLSKLFARNSLAISLALLALMGLIGATIVSVLAYQNSARINRQLEIANKQATVAAEKAESNAAYAIANEREAKENLELAKKTLLDYGHLLRADGLLLIDRRQFDQAKHNLLRAEKQVDSLLEIDAEEEAYIRLYAVVQTGLGDVAGRGENDLEKSTEHYLNAVSAYEVLNENQSKNHVYLNEHGYLFNNLGQVERLKGDNQQAAKYFGKGVGKLNESLEVDSNYVTTYLGLARGYLGLALTGFDFSSEKEIADWFQKSEDSGRKAIEMYPQSPGYRYEAYGALVHYANWLQQTGDFDKSLEKLDLALTYLEQLQREVTVSSSYLPNLLALQQYKSKLLKQLERLQEVEKVEAAIKEINKALGN